MNGQRFPFACAAGFQATRGSDYAPSAIAAVEGERSGLPLDGWHPGMHRQAGHCSGIGECRGKLWRHELRIPHFHRVERAAGQDGDERRDPRSQPRYVGHEPPAERWKLKHERPRLRFESRQRRPHERLLGGGLAVARAREYANPQHASYVTCREARSAS